MMKPTISRRDVLTLAGTVGAFGAVGLAMPAAAHAVDVVGTPNPHVDPAYFEPQVGQGFFARALSSFDSWVAANENRYIDLDGAYGAQCWDLWESYCRAVVGCSNISTQYGAHPGYAIGLWDGFAHNGAARYFTKIPASSTPRKGDVAFWHYGQTYTPWSHVAMVVSDAGSNVYCFSQNSTPSQPGNPYPGQSTGPSIKQYLPKHGLAGYLRPLISVGPPIRSAADLLAVDSSGVLWNYPALGNGTFGSRIQIGVGWGSMVSGWTVDWNGDGTLDIVAKWNNGDLRLYRGQADGSFASHLNIGSGWQNLQIAPSRFNNSNAYPGLLGRDAGGKLWYYPNTNGSYLVAGGTQIGEGWGALNILSMDFNGDGNQDVLGIDSSKALRLYKGNGAGGWIDASGAAIGNDWNFVSVATTTGFAGPGTRGLYAQSSDGRLHYYPVIGGGTFGQWSVVGEGWSGFNILNAQRIG